MAQFYRQICICCWSCVTSIPSLTLSWTNFVLFLCLSIFQSTDVANLEFFLQADKKPFKKILINRNSQLLCRDIFRWQLVDLKKLTVIGMLLAIWRWTRWFYWHLWVSTIKIMQVKLPIFCICLCEISSQSRYNNFHFEFM